MKYKPDSIDISRPLMDVLPRLPIHNGADISYANPKFGSQCGKRFSVTRPAPNFDNLQLMQFCSIVLRALCASGTLPRSAIRQLQSELNLIAFGFCDAMARGAQ
jgi:hypothetical protein